MIDEHKFQEIFTKKQTAEHYESELNKLKIYQFGLLVEEWNRGRSIVSEYTLKSAVERVESDNNMKIMEPAMQDIKDFIALTLARGE